MPLPLRLLVGVLALLTAGCGATGPPELAGVVRTPALEVASVRLPAAEDGRPVAFQADPGELLIVYFGYTFCPDICPTTMGDIRAAIADLPDDLAERVSVVFVTVDPVRDTPEALERYLGNFFDEAVTARTEDLDDLQAAADAFGVRFEIPEPDPTNPNYAVAHTAVTYVVDDTGTVVVEWPFGFERKPMTADLQALLTKERL